MFRFLILTTKNFIKVKEFPPKELFSNYFGVNNPPKVFAKYRVVHMYLDDFARLFRGQWVT